MLDIHVSPSPESPAERPLEILEAGTGHGALTLYLARAIHAANSLLPQELLTHMKGDVVEPRSEDDRTSATSDPPDDGTVSDYSISTHEREAIKTKLEQWKSKRHAVIHTLDISPKHSEHAKKIVYGFRQGIYAGNTEFHVDNVNDWIDQQVEMRAKHDPISASKEFLSHVILDLPSSYLSIAKASSVLHVSGSLLAFNPSITQIVACVDLIRDMRLPLVLDQVLETGSTLTGGRAWDVRAVRPRVLSRNRVEEKQDTFIGNASLDREPIEIQASSENIAGQETRDEEQAYLQEQEKTGWEMICRPKAGDKWASGGGFLGVWRKMRRREV